MKQIELAWAAGFFDGEGCVTYVNHSGKSRTRALRINITQRFSEVLYRFRDAVGGIGRVNGPYAARGRKNPLYVYSVTKQADVKAVYGKLKPFLGSVKRAQFEETITRWDDRNVQFRRI